MSNDFRRVKVIDSMRGFSLFGILLANMLIFQYGIYGKDMIHLFSLSPSDSAAYVFLKVAVEESFMPIFTFLFGYSMVKMKESLERRQLGVKRHFFRRFLLLLGLGLLHGVFLWEGDILTFYGMMGVFLLLFFLNRKAKTLLVLASILLILTGAAGYGSLNDNMYLLSDKQTLTTYVKDTIHVYGSGTYEQIKDHRNNVDPMNMAGYKFAFAFLFTPFIMGDLFLFGMYAGKEKWFYDVSANQKQYGRWAAALIPLGLLLKGTMYLWPDANWAGSTHMLGGSLLSLGYIAGFAWLYAKCEKSFLMKAFESVGRISLSNYLMQTVICTTIFYGYGLGCFGKLGTISGIFVCIGIYGIQLIGSYMYVQKFKTGPVEKLLRIWTNFSWSGKPKEKKALPTEVNHPFVG
ncbi:DUF418 domain-containing protein [Priestia megaterium]|uniref:DUF418 domain-containing protein n=1 Tax=Priestia megaterium TaxID=1404 RepID=UPI001868856F|nr:DUF418 domain-containing protein [Priestia megaterium]MBE2977398.1 DUF418 domain-containing protein [Priestia megaterium]